MDLIELAKEAGLVPLREGKTYCSPCPACSGDNRFIIWPEENRYWCRRCKKNGDAIQFCRDFLEMNYFEACKKLNLTGNLNNTRTVHKKAEKLHIAKFPSDLWLQKAWAFTLWSHQQLLKSPCELLKLYERGLNLDTIEKFHLGLCRDPTKKIASGFFLKRQTWGLDQEFKENGEERKLWLPYGIVIPSYDANKQIVKLKIRRLDWYPEDKYSKYVEVSGSMQQPSWFGQNDELPVTIVEAEIDAILIQQEASSLCSSLALGGAAKKPDAATDLRLRKNPLLLFALDFDEAGKKEFLYWRESYPHLRAWPIPKTKSPGDAFKEGISLQQWIYDGILQYDTFIKRNLSNES